MPGPFLVQEDFSGGAGAFPLTQANLAPTGWEWYAPNGGTPTRNGSGVLYAGSGDGTTTLRGKFEHAYTHLTANITVNVVMVAADDSSEPSVTLGGYNLPKLLSIIWEPDAASGNVEIKYRSSASATTTVNCPYNGFGTLTFEVALETTGITITGDISNSSATDPFHVGYIEWIDLGVGETNGISYLDIVGEETYRENVILAEYFENPGGSDVALNGTSPAIPSGDSWVSTNLKKIAGNSYDETSPYFTFHKMGSATPVTGSNTGTLTLTTAAPLSDGVFVHIGFNLYPTGGSPGYPNEYRSYVEMEASDGALLRFTFGQNIFSQMTVLVEWTPDGGGTVTEEIFPSPSYNPDDGTWLFYCTFLPGGFNFKVVDPATSFGGISTQSFIDTLTGFDMTAFADIKKVRVNCSNSNGDNEISIPYVVISDYEEIVVVAPDYQYRSYGLVYDTELPLQFRSYGLVYNTDNRVLQEKLITTQLNLTHREVDISTGTAERVLVEHAIAMIMRDVPGVEKSITLGMNRVDGELVIRLDPAIVAAREVSIVLGSVAQVAKELAVLIGDDLPIQSELNILIGNTTGVGREVELRLAQVLQAAVDVQIITSMRDEVRQERSITVGLEALSPVAREVVLHWALSRATRLTGHTPPSITL